MQITRYFCRILMKREFSQQIFAKYSRIKFHENPSSGSQVLCGQTNRRTDTDMMNLIVAFHNFSNAPKKETNIHALSGIRTCFPPAIKRLHAFALDRKASHVYVD
jgi:hypothetical protein